ncbi:hypothetical protein MMC21_002020 [Puttea exsequens]|nr:hypothetical protein [Puttea exsequens]
MPRTALFPSFHPLHLSRNRISDHHHRKEHIHFTHHTLNVPYAYGSLYTHPLEGLLQDTLGVALAFHLTTMSTRQGMLFYFASTVKDVHDHCRYALPWIMVHSAATYHDLHHQSWGGKWNFSVYTCFWDWVFGTLWTDGEAARRCYEKGVEVTGVVRAGVGKFEIPETPVDCGGRDLGPKVE